MLTRSRRALQQGVSLLRRTLNTQSAAQQLSGDGMPLKRTTGRVLVPEQTVSFAASAFASAVHESPAQAAQALRATLSQAQRRALVDMLCDGNSPERLSARDAFELADVDKDGMISRGEFERAAKGSYSFSAAVKEIHAAAAPPPAGVIFRVAAVSSIPFIGFGFCDNSIMILSGDAIQDFGGAALGLSVMAAAGLGNMVSDVLGIGISGSIERTCNRLGLKPALSPAQMALPRTQWSINIGRCLGIAVGCLLGMFPLLLDDHEALQAQSGLAAAAASASKQHDGGAAGP